MTLAGAASTSVVRPRRLLLAGAVVPGLALALLVDLLAAHLVGFHEWR
jgi:hypothetical protein